MMSKSITRVQLARVSLYLFSGRFGPPWIQGQISGKLSWLLLRYIEATPANSVYLVRTHALTQIPYGDFRYTQNVVHSFWWLFVNKSLINETG